MATAAPARPAAKLDERIHLALTVLGVPTIALFIAYTPPVLVAALSLTLILGLPLYKRLKRAGRMSKRLEIGLSVLMLTGLFAPIALILEPFDQYERGKLLLVAFCLAAAYNVRAVAQLTEKARTDADRLSVRQVLALRLGLLVMMTAYFFLVAITCNWGFDVSRALATHAVVIGKDASRSRLGTEYMLTVRQFGREDEVTTREEDYHALKVGDPVCVTWHRGALSAKWVETGRCR